MTLSALLRPLALAWFTLGLAGLAPAASPNPDQDLPETLRRSYTAPIVGPANNTAYARGALGLIHPGYGPASLYVAWRVMQLPTGALARESHTRQGHWLYAGPPPANSPEDEKDAWLSARAAVVPQAPAVAPDYFRTGTLNVPGVGQIRTEEGHCGPDAYSFATRTLAQLLEDASLTPAQRRAWVATQDAVFARCTLAASAKRPPLPAAPAANAPAKLKALHAYQRAAALFYEDAHEGALRAFDAIAADPAHPMRPWATLGALRSVLRGTVHDPEWQAAVDAAWNGRQLRGAAFNAAVAEPAARRRARVATALTEMDKRSKAALADASLAPVHGAIRYTLRRALLQLAPAVPLLEAMSALDRPDYNPYTYGALDLFQELYLRVAPARPEGPTATRLRQHAWFDFIVTVQACAEGEAAAGPAACDAEHAHALERWQATHQTAWLLATLMTAREPSPADLPAAEAARAVASQRPEWASLQLYAARVLSRQGRSADARLALDALASSRAVHPRDLALVEAARAGL